MLFEVVMVVRCYTFIIPQIINQKLYQVVREENQLAYDASFQLHSSSSAAPKSLLVINDQLRPSNWYSIAVTTTPDKVCSAQ